MSVVEQPAPGVPRLLTAEEFWRLYGDQGGYELIDGIVHQPPPVGLIRDEPMTARNRARSAIESNIVYLLKSWQVATRAPGKVHGGEGGFILRRDPDLLAGIDVAYASPGVIAATAEGAAFHDGPPVLAVEILSPFDTREAIVTKVRNYLEVGVVAWVVGPDFRTVGIHRPGQPVKTLNDRDEIQGDPELPGFRAPVSDFFV